MIHFADLPEAWLNLVPDTDEAVITVAGIEHTFRLAEIHYIGGEPAAWEFVATSPDAPCNNVILRRTT